MGQALLSVDTGEEDFLVNVCIVIFSQEFRIKTKVALLLKAGEGASIVANLIPGLGVLMLLGSRTIEGS